MNIKNISTEDLINYITWTVTGATLIRLALHWTRQLLQIWISETSTFWIIYGKLELSLSYIAGSLAAYGNKTSLPKKENGNTPLL